MADADDFARPDAPAAPRLDHRRLRDSGDAGRRSRPSLGGEFEDPVTITLPGGQTPSFALAHEARGDGFAEAGIIKDAGDDPDVTHGALVHGPRRARAARQRSDVPRRRGRGHGDQAGPADRRRASRRSTRCRGG